MKLFLKKIKSLFLKQEGQSLVEIVIALAIGAILIGGASTAIVVVLQSSKTSQIQQSATALAQGLVENVRVYAFSDWSNVYGLNKTSSTVYFMHSSSTDNFHLEGKEGIVDNGIQSGLAGHWKLDSVTGSTVYDFSGNDNDGVLNNGVLQATSSVCWVGGCLDFDGTDDYVEVSDDNVLDVSSFTISLWIYPKAWGSSQRFLHKNNSYVMWDSGSDIRFTYYDGASWNATVLNYSDVSTEQWHHFSYIHDENSGSTAYVDGKVVSTGGSAEAVNSSGNNLYFGSIAGSNPFDGYLDDVRIYSRALTSNEVESLYDSTMFDRYFYVENVCRTNDANYEIGGVSPCGAGEALDPLTQKVTAVIEWPGKEEETNFSLSEYITRWKNDVFTQSDWSGGEGLDGPVTDYTDSFSSSTDVDYSDLGEIKIEGF